MKRYIKPAIEFIEVETAPILEGSLWIDNGEGGTVDPEKDQLSGEHRGDWENIWGNM